MWAWVKRPGPGRAGQARQRGSATSPISHSITPRDVDGALGAVAAGNGDFFRVAARHVGVVGGRDHRREAMGPIPGYIVSGGVADVVRRGRRHARRRFAVGRPVAIVAIVAIARPVGEGAVVAAEMPE